jgi:hypothetical protein
MRKSIYLHNLGSAGRIRTRRRRKMNKKTINRMTDQVGRVIAMR